MWLRVVVSIVEPTIKTFGGDAFGIILSAFF
jgi:hypothetical protein